MTAARPTPAGRRSISSTKSSRATNGSSQTLYAFIPQVASGADRTLSVLASYAAPGADNYNHLVAWGYPATSQMYSICVRTTLFPAGTIYNAIGNHYYSAQYTTGYSTTSGGSTPARITARYSSGSDRFYRNGVQIGTAMAGAVTAGADLTPTFAVGKTSVTASMTADMDYIAKQGDTWAFSDFDGFPARDLNFNVFGVASKF